MAAAQRHGCRMTDALLLAIFLGFTCAPPSCAAVKTSFVNDALNMRARRDAAAAQPDVGLDPHCVLYSRVSMTSLQGSITTRYDVFCLGWQFYGGVVTVETDSNGTIVTPGGVDIQPAALQSFAPTLSVTANLTESDAFAIVAALYNISSANFALYAADQLIDRNWYYDGVNVVAVYKLLFTYGLPATSEYSQPTAIVDLLTGEVIIHWDGLNGVGQEYINGIGGNLAYGIYGTSPWAYNYGTTFCFIDSTARFQVNNYQGTSSAVAKPFCGSLSSITTYGSTVLQLNGAYYYAPLVDAAYTVKVTNELFKYLVGVGFNGASTTQVNIHVNYATLDDAYTNTATSEVFIGTGATTFYPLATCNDVVSHELAHIFLARYSSLSNTGQGGAISEAFCDMAAEAVEYYVSGAADYKFATKCLKDKTKAAARYLCTPELDGGITSASQWVTGMNIYKASGVYRKAFCLAAKCTTATIGVLNAFKTFARANMLYWSPLSNFNTAACGVRKAASGVFTQPAQIACFVNAFATVGITIPSTCV